MHLPNKLIVLLSLCLAAVPFTHAADGGYVRVSAVHVMTESDVFDDATGAMVALGASFENRYSESANQFEMEFGYTKFDYSDSGFIGGTPFSGEVKLTAIPALLTYRYQWNITDRLGLAIGPSVGMTYLKGSGSLTVGGTPFSAADTDWIFSYGAGVQLNFAVTETVALTLGYRYLVNEDASFKDAGVELTDMDAQMLEIGLRFGWPY